MVDTEGRQGERLAEGEAVPRHPVGEAEEALEIRPGGRVPLRRHLQGRRVLAGARPLRLPRVAVPLPPRRPGARPLDRGRQEDNHSEGLRVHLPGRASFKSQEGRSREGRRRQWGQMGRFPLLLCIRAASEMRLLRSVPTTDSSEI